MRSNSEAPHGRHHAPEPANALRIARLADLERPGRHAEPVWHREQFDGVRDEDPFDWLGFSDDVA